MQLLRIPCIWWQYFNTGGLFLRYPIEHVIVLMLENRAFDHMCGYLKTINPEIDGLNGNESNPYDPLNPNSKRVYVNDQAPYVTPNPGHEIEGKTCKNNFCYAKIRVWQRIDMILSDFYDANPLDYQLLARFGFIKTTDYQLLTILPSKISPIFTCSLVDATQQIFGERNRTFLDPPPMDGFVANAENHSVGWGPQIMSCFNPQTVPVISTLATEFAFFDRWYSSVPGPTETNRMYVHSATSAGAGDNDLELLLEGYPQKTIYNVLYEQGTEGESDI